MFDRLWITLSLHHASIYVPLEDEIARLTQLSELQREEILSVRIFLPTALALVASLRSRQNCVANRLAR